MKKVVCMLAMVMLVGCFSAKVSCDKGMFFKECTTAREDMEIQYYQDNEIQTWEAGR